MWLTFLWTSEKNPKVSPKDILYKVLKNAFESIPEVDFLLYLLPKGTKSFSPLSEYFVQSKQMTYPSHKLEFCHRSEFVPRLKVRRARVEDHDDLVPIFNKQSQLLPEIHDKFFLAQLIESQDEDNRTLVVEV